MPAGNPAGYLTNIKGSLKKAGTSPYKPRSKRRRPGAPTPAAATWSNGRPTWSKGGAPAPPRRTLKSRRSV